MITPADLCRIELFTALEGDVLERLAAAMRERRLAAGEYLVRDGDPPASFLLLLEGEAEGLFSVDGHEERDKFHQAPTWMGAISLLVERPWAASMRAYTECRVGELPRAAFLELLHEQRSVELRVMRAFQPVFERRESLTRQREKLAALGTMAAGLAHELNNPAAAARRSAEELAEALQVLGSTIGDFVEGGVERAEAEQLVALQRQALRRAAEPPARLSALERSEGEDELTDALERLGLPEPWELAEPLAEAGLDAAWLERVEELAGPARAAAVRWIAASLTARGLVEDLRASAERISTLVGAVKEYSYMDRADTQSVDVNQGLESTLTILAHKLKHGSIEVRRDLDATLPRLTAHGSELNQVWTNLLDNAIDALDGQGELTIRTGRDGDGAVRVEIADSGPGIPADVRDRIFDPFFTTKDVGHGTGLGLDTARRIVVDRHHGRLELLDAQPGTRAVVTLPAAP